MNSLGNLLFSKLDNFACGRSPFINHDQLIRERFSLIHKIKRASINIPLCSFIFIKSDIQETEIVIVIKGSINMTLLCWMTICMYLFDFCMLYFPSAIECRMSGLFVSLHRHFYYLGSLSKVILIFCFIFLLLNTRVLHIVGVCGTSRIYD